MATGYALIDNPNPHARRWARSKGMDHAFWGYAPPRRAQTRLIGVHTGENAPDFTPPDTGAENIASYLAGVDRPASYHAVGDSDSVVPLLPDTYTAFGIRSLNSPTLHWSFATKAHRWSSTPSSWQDQILRRAAAYVAGWVDDYRIPLREVTLEQANNGAAGFIRHSTADPSRRSDPGRDFPMATWLRLIDAHDTEEGLSMAKVSREEFDALTERVDAIWKATHVTVTDDDGTKRILEHANVLEALIHEVLRRLADGSGEAIDPKELSREIVLALGRKLTDA